VGKRMNRDAQIKVVKEAMAGIKVGVLARMYDLHPETIRNWIRDLRDTIPVEEIPVADEHLQELQRLQDVEQQFEKAVKMIGEKELEIEMLRELLKKKDPAYLKKLK
jgi:transposase-like protein